MATSQAAHLLGLVKVALSAAITSQVLKCGRLGHAQVAVAGASLQGNNAAVRFAWQSAGQGRVAEWQSGRVAAWQSGRVAEWQSGRVAEWQSGRVAEWQRGRCDDCSFMHDAAAASAAAQQAASIHTASVAQVVSPQQRSPSVKEQAAEGTPREATPGQVATAAGKQGEGRGRGQGARACTGHHPGLAPAEQCWH